MRACVAIALLAMQDGRYEPDNYGVHLRPPTEELYVGPWRAWLESPGGELPFGLEIAREGAKLSTTIVNGEERILLPTTTAEGAELVLDMPHYDSTIRARISPYGARLTGEWKKRSGADRWTTMPFRAEAGEAPRFRPIEDARAMTQALQGRFAVKFEKSDDPAVAILRPGTGSGIEGTILTTTGDYRWLAGSIEGERLRLSCFDGAHAFLFDASLDAQGVLRGRFWSGDRWQEGWEARPDSNATIPDAFEQAHWKEGFGLAQLLYPDLQGSEHCLGEPALGGKAIVLQLLGSWCPNCHDETAYLAKVYERYRERGLSVIGLAFELTGDFERDAEQVRRMSERHGVKYPMLLAGLADKKKAAEAFPALDRLLAFPTTIFLHRDGRVRAVHSGFAGPGTKEEHESLAKRFEALIEELLAEPDSDDRAIWDELTTDAWRGSRLAWQARFTLDPSGKRQVEWDGFSHKQRQPRSPAEVVIRGTTVAIGGEPWHYDRRARVLLHARDFGDRLEPAARRGLCSIDGSPPLEGRALLPMLESSDPLWRREACFQLAKGTIPRGIGSIFDPTPLLEDPDPIVRSQAAWACWHMRTGTGGPELVAMTQHGFVGERREAARALGVIHYEAAEGALKALERDIDPLVRIAAKSGVRRK